MKDIDQSSNNMIPNQDNRYPPYQNNTYYCVSNKEGRQDQYFDPNNFDQKIVQQWDNRYDVEQIKTMWKKERNRLAAKKSRDKKAIQIRELEYRDKKMTEEIRIFKECIIDYDNILAELIGYLEYILGLNRNENRDDFILLFDCLCKLKKNGNNSHYMIETSEMIERQLRVTNNRIDNLTCKIRESLREFLSKKNGQYE
ncbi:leucine zipper domain-containing protein [Tubulinosema ratisbonensis]|uniref:Leucine zipper domain-containing protein n=1 Tax=Tubulinosema ratisbonensis TaxID=291195 RepID=A0A437AI31_9MICR|nr:leucine zipper domain-containing protein [Tubulinosema ratisbonensis]